MKRFHFLPIIACMILWSCASLSAHAAGLKQQGTSVDDLVPAGWVHQEAQGDLNKDGIVDLVVVATPDYPENTFTRDDGFVYNFNQPVLAIYFGNAQGLELWRSYDNVIPADETRDCLHDIGLEITQRGALCIKVQLFCSAGGYGTTAYTYTYRYQNGDFFLIGMDREEMQRNTGLCTVVSENYLTWKCQVKTFTVMDEGVQPTEKWTRLSKRKLEKLGAREL